jgi:hypothetical protein
MGEEGDSFTELILFGFLGAPSVESHEMTSASVDQCSICLERPSSEARIDGCDHTFCLECIDAWAKTTNKCPLCKSEFVQIRRVGVPASVKRPRNRRKDGVPPEIVNVRKRRQLADYDDDEIARLVVSDEPLPPHPNDTDDEALDEDFTASTDRDDEEEGKDEDEEAEVTADDSNETEPTDNDESKSDFLLPISDDNDGDSSFNPESPVLRETRSSSRLKEKRKGSK